MEDNQAKDLSAIKKFRAGNKESLNEIMDRYKTLVISLSRRFFLLGAEQEDLIQEGMIGLFKACQNYDETVQLGSFKSFAYLCIMRKMQTAIKTANRQKNLVLNGALSINSQDGIDYVQASCATENNKVIFLPAFQKSPEDEIISKESEKEMREKLQTLLSPLECQILDYYLEGFKCSEIATQTNIAYKKVDNALYRIKQKLEQVSD